MPTGAQGSDLLLDAVFADGTGQAVTPVGPLVTLLNPSGAPVIGPLAPAALGQPGRYGYTFAIPADAPLGTWTARWSGLVNGVAVGADETFQVVTAGTVGFGYLDPIGPSGAWLEPADLSCAVADQAVAARAIAAATEVLWSLSGRRYGEVVTTLRPCRGPAVGPLNDHRSLWWNVCGCADSCGHGSSGAIVLPYGPVQAVTNVQVDGVPLVEGDDWRYDGTYLYRVGGTWPLRQDLAAADGEVGSFSVTYRHGLPVPVMAKAAVDEIACEFVKAAEGAPCRLPQRVTNLTRQGVSMTLLDPQDFLTEGRTGFYTADLWLATVNPGSATGPSAVWSPDTNRGRTVRR